MYIVGCVSKFFVPHVGAQIWKHRIQIASFIQPFLQNSGCIAVSEIILPKIGKKVRGCTRIGLRPTVFDPAIQLISFQSITIATYKEILTTASDS